jgi:hypothetical protein
MPGPSQQIAEHSRKVRHLIADYLQLWRGSAPSGARRAALAREIHDALAYLDQHAVVLGATKTSVEDLLGPAPGGVGTDVWYYPSDVSSQTYEVAFDHDHLIRKGFITVRFN